MRIQRNLSQQSLSLKLAVAIGVIISIIIAIGTFFLVNVTRRGIAETSVTNALYQSQLLKGKLIESMLGENPGRESIEALIQEQKQASTLNEINIFDMNGKVEFSTALANVNQRIDWPKEKREHLTSDEALVDFHGSGKDGKLRIIHPIRSTFQCTSCHNVQQGQVIGGIELFVPLRPVYERFAVNNTLIVLIALVFVVIVALFIRLVVHRIVKRPIHKLMKTMEKAELGELNARVSIHEDPDLRRLAKSFNTMVRGIENAQKRIQAQHQKELSQSNRLASLGQYMSKVSHEIKNPLAAISAALHALKSEFEARDQLAVYEELSHQLERIERTVNNLLRYAKQAPPHFAKCSLLDPIHHALASAAHRLKDSRIRVQINSDIDEPILEADEGQLEQVFLNLVLNAIDAMPKGGDLKINIKVAENNLVVEFEDTGFGINPELQAKIFEPFFSTKKGGTGLGLSVVKGIVELHGGKIEIENSQSQGAKIKLLFRLQFFDNQPNDSKIVMGAKGY